MTEQEIELRNRRKKKLFIANLAVFINGAIAIGIFATHLQWTVLCLAEVIAFQGVYLYMRSDYPSISDIIHSVIWGGITVYMYFCLKRSDHLLDANLLVAGVMIMFGIMGTRIAFVSNFIALRDSLRRTAAVDALIVDVDVRRETYSDEAGRVSNATVYIPLYEFALDGMVFHKYGKKNRTLPPKKGTYKKLLVNPKDPDDFGEGMRYNPALGIGYIVLGAVIMFIGYFFSQYVANTFNIYFNEFINMLK